MKKKKNDVQQTAPLSILFPHVAGIDIGSKSHFVAVPPDRDDEHVKEFSTFTSDLHEVANWLEKCKIKTVILESTGVYWIPTFEILEQRGFEVKLVDARKVKNVSAHKTDYLDCQWLQKLGTYGLLKGAFRPDDEILPLRAYLRQRNMLIKSAAMHVKHMQKALVQMNVQLHNVISDITGITGMAIIRSIVKGIRDPKVLAEHRTRNCRNPIEVIEASLVGNYREEHVFSLKQALELYDFYTQKVLDCEKEIYAKTKKFESKCDEARLAKLNGEAAERELSKKKSSKNMNTPLT